MQRPQWNSGINLNTILLALTLLLSGAGWGVTWQTQVAATSRANERIDAALLEIAKVSTELRSSVADIHSSMKTYADLPYRVTALEAQFASMNSSQRELERALTQLASDMRVTREIVERMDPARRGATR